MWSCFAELDVCWFWPVIGLMAFFYLFFKAAKSEAGQGFMVGFLTEFFRRR